MKHLMTLLTGMGLLLMAGCETTDSARTSGDSPEMTGVKADRARIQESLATMDEVEDAGIPMAMMRELIDDGLYDPQNKNPLVVGDEAPDFELMPLRFYDFAIDRGINQDNAGSLFEPVRLSAFRGNLPVVLIFGSYT